MGCQDTYGESRLATLCKANTLLLWYGLSPIPKLWLLISDFPRIRSQNPKSEPPLLLEQCKPLQEREGANQRQTILVSEVKPRTRRRNGTHKFQQVHEVKYEPLEDDVITKENQRTFFVLVGGPKTCLAPLRIFFLVTSLAHILSVPWWTFHSLCISTY